MGKGDAMTIGTLLSRLQKVKKTGNGKWMCQCSAHDDKTASLVITDAGDGRILLNCFAGCDTYSILQAVGLDWQDIMPERASSHFSEKPKSIIYASEAMQLIKFETQIVLVAAYDLKKGKPLQHNEVERLELAMQRIGKAYQGAGL